MMRGMVGGAVVRLALIAVVWLPCAPAWAQLPVATAHTFNGRMNPRAPLGNAPVTGADGTVYGLTWEGGAHGRGTVFRWRVEEGVSALHSFTAVEGTPVALTQGSDGHLYGLTEGGDRADRGLHFFRLSTTGLWAELGTSIPISSKFQVGGRSADDGGHFYELADGTFIYFGNSRVARISPSGAWRLMFSQGAVGADVLGSDGAVYLVGLDFPGIPNDGYHAVRLDPFTDSVADVRRLPDNAPGWIAQAIDGHLYGLSLLPPDYSRNVRFWRLTTTGTYDVIRESLTLPGSPAVWTAGPDGSFYGLTTQFGGQTSVFRVTTSGDVTPYLGTVDGASALSIRATADGSLIGTYGGGYAWQGFGTTPGGLFRAVPTGIPTFGFSRFSFGSEGYHPIALRATPYGRVGVTAHGGPTDNGSLFEVADDGSVTTIGALSPIGSEPSAHPTLGRGLTWMPVTAACPAGCYAGTLALNGDADASDTVYRFVRASAGAPGRFELLRNLAVAEGSDLVALVSAPDGVLFGVARGGGEGGGTLFGLAPNGTLTVLHRFRLTDGDGYSPNSLLRAPDGTLYGTTYYGTAGPAGTVFRLATDGRFSVVHRFSDAAGAANLLRARDGSLWGTLDFGSASVFQLRPSGESRLFSGPRLTSLVETDTGEYFGACAAATGPALCRVSAEGVIRVVATHRQPITALLPGPDGRLFAATEPDLQRVDGRWLAVLNGGLLLRVGLTPPAVTANLRLTLAVARPSDGSLQVAGAAPLTGAGAVGAIAMPGDFNGDGTLDVAFFNSSTGAWAIPGIGARRFGTAGDRPVPADYDGDGRTDLAVFRPSTATWFIDGRAPVVFGEPGDLPVPGDYRGLGHAQLAVYRRGTWYVDGLAPAWWGAPTDRPVPADYDGDRRVDIAVYRPASGTWFVRGQFTQAWGGPGDVPAPQDLTGDGRVELIVYRRATGQWFTLDRTGQAVDMVRLGGPADVPLFAAPWTRTPGDVDGDGRADLALFRAEAATVFVAPSSASGTQAITWGALTDRRVLADYDGDGILDVAAYRPSTGQWFVRRATGDSLTLSTGAPGPYAQPVSGDFDGDGLSDAAVYHADTGVWQVRRSSDGQLDAQTWGAARQLDRAVAADFDGDGRTDRAVWRQTTGTWFVLRSSDQQLLAITGQPSGPEGRAAPADFDGDGRVDPGVLRADGSWWVSTSSGVSVGPVRWGNPAVGDIPVPLDYDGDGRADVTVYRTTTGQWYLAGSSVQGNAVVQFGSPANGDVPLFTSPR